MYAEYIREREGKEILEHEHGFTIYGYNCLAGVDFPHVYIQDNYVRPEHRKKGVAREMADRIAEQAKALGIKVMLGSVDTQTRGADASLKVLIAYGMSLYTVNGNMIYMQKELK
jgi:GNAT superfamily N-acetyltransferase